MQIQDALTRCYAKIRAIENSPVNRGAVDVEYQTAERARGTRRVVLSDRESREAALVYYRQAVDRIKSLAPDDTDTASRILAEAPVWNRLVEEV